MENKKIKKDIGLIIKKSAILYCIIFTITTLVSSVIQLSFMGRQADYNLHIINRAVLIMIAVIIITLFDKVKLKNKILTYIVPYIISMIIVFIYVWITGFWEELHPNAYRDVFLNFTVVSIILAVVIKIKNNLQVKF